MTKLKWSVAVVATLCLFVMSRFTGPNFRYTVAAKGPGFTVSHKAPRVITDSEPADLRMTLAGDPANLDQVQVWVAPRKTPAVPAQPISPASVETSLRGDAAERVYHFDVQRLSWGGKYDYYFQADVKGGTPVRLDRAGAPMMVKFRGDVPTFLLVLHIVPMFAGFMLVIASVMLAFAAVRKGVAPAGMVKYGFWGWVAMAVGGLPLGFVMNWCAFGEMWGGWPFGSDVTDNKTQIALLIYGAALLAGLKWPGKKAGWALILGTASVVAVYVIPHSL